MNSTATPIRSTDAPVISEGFHRGVLFGTIGLTASSMLAAGIWTAAHPDITGLALTGWLAVAGAAAVTVAYRALATLGVQAGHATRRALAAGAMVGLLAIGIYALAPLGADAAVGSGSAAVVDTDAVNVRGGASASADVVETLEAGAGLTVTGDAVSADGYDWVPVSVDADGSTGWVVAGYLADSGERAVGTAVTVGEGGVNLRADAGIDADLIETLAAGSTVTIESAPIAADGYAWYQVSSDSGEGYVAGEALSGFSTAAAATDTDTTATDDTGTAVDAASTTGIAIDDAVSVDTDALNLRDDATTDGGILATLETGATGTVVDGPVSADGYDWVQVETDAGTGWVDAEYLTLQ